MIISHSRRFIFIKIKKTAGSSLEAALGRYCDDTDIITSLPKDEEKFRMKYYGRGAQNCRIPLKKWTAQDWIRVIKGKQIEFYNHVPAVYVMRHIDRDLWNKYFKFCFERSPFEKVISYVYFKFSPENNLNAYITNSLLHTIQKGGSRLYRYKNEILVDKIYRYEELPAAMEDLSSRLELDPPLELPRLKAGYRKDRQMWHEILSKESIQKIRDCFSWELETLYPDVAREADKILAPVFSIGGVRT